MIAGPASPRSIPRTQLVAYTAWRKSGLSARKPSPLYDIRLGSQGGYSSRIDGAGARSVNAFSPAVAVSKASALIAWQDMARGVGEIWMARLGSPVRRVRVVGKRRGNAWRPALAVSGGTAVVGWEDDRDGLSQIYVRRMPLPFVPSRP